MASDKKKATAKERAIAKKLLSLVGGSEKCPSVYEPCAVLLTCDPMSCDGLTTHCPSLKKQ